MSYLSNHHVIFLIQSSCDLSYPITTWSVYAVTNQFPRMQCRLSMLDYFMWFCRTQVQICITVKDMKFWNSTVSANPSNHHDLSMVFYLWYFAILTTRFARVSKIKSAHYKYSTPMMTDGLHLRVDAQMVVLNGLHVFYENNLRRGSCGGLLIPAPSTENNQKPQS